MTSAGVLDRRDGTYRRFTRTAGGATIAPEEVLPAAAAEAREGIDWTRAVEEDELLDATEADHDQERFLAGETTPVIFASAVSNFGVGALLDVLVDLAPPPAGRPDADGAVRKLDDPFSAFVFKVQSGMDAAHRDRLAYIRIASGVFERGMVVTHATTGRPFATKYAQHVFGRDRESVDVAYPGDVVGLVNANALHVGDTLYADAKVQFPPLTTFAPEYFAVMRARTAPSSSSSAAGSPSWPRRAWRRCCARTAAATRRRCSPSSGRCSSRWPSTGWRTSSVPRWSWTGCPTRSPCAPTPSPPRPSPRPAASRCWSARTASCWRCSWTSGTCARCSSATPS